jgi:hypothetical protein
VEIPTTTGLVEVERLLEEQIDRSVICVGASTLHNPRLDKAYTDFVGAGTGVIERLFGHASFRLEVSQEIDHGSSWQLGAFIAHALHRARRLAEKGRHADTIVWATGEVRYDLSVGPVGHVADKLRLSLQHLTTLAKSGRRVLLALPTENMRECQQWAPTLAEVGAEVHAVSRTQDLLKVLDLAIPATAAASQAGTARASRTGRKIVYLGVGLGLASLIAAVVLSMNWNNRAITLSLPKTHYAVGEPFSFTIHATKDCPFLVLTVDGLGKPRLYEPAVEGAFMGAPLLKAGEKRRIPVQGTAVVEPPAGTYQIAALCDKDELARLGLASTSRNRRNFGFKVQDTVYTIDRDELDKIAISYDVRDR